MRGRHTLQGQIVIIALIVLLGLAIVFTLASALWPLGRAVPVVRRAFWEVEGHEVTTAIVGQKIEIHVVVEAIEQYAGSVVVKIRKDVRLWFDTDFEISTVPVNLPGGEQKEIDVDFIPDEASRGSLRGYFVEVEFLATRTNWLMESSYPPRLEVTG